MLTSAAENNTAFCTKKKKKNKCEEKTRRAPQESLHKITDGGKKVTITIRIEQRKAALL